MIIIDDLVDLVPISAANQVKVKGGNQNNYNYYDNRALAIAYAYADGPNTFTVAETSVKIGRGYSMAESFSLAQSSSQP